MSSIENVILRNRDGLASSSLVCRKFSDGFFADIEIAANSIIYPDQGFTHHNYRSGSDEEVNFKKKLWVEVKHEFHKLICASDSNYEKTREIILKDNGMTEVAIVMTVSTAIADALDSSAVGLVSGFASLLLLAVAKAGHSAICKVLSEEVDAKGNMDS